MRHLRWILVAIVTASCGGAQITSDAAEAREAGATAAWTDAQLGKLEPTLRTRVRSGERDRVAVRVFFLELPTDAELSDLLLNRMGDQAIGEVVPEVLQRIAARGDVERIEALSDIGY